MDRLSLLPGRACLGRGKLGDILNRSAPAHPATALSRHSPLGIARAAAGFTKTRHFGGWSNRQRGSYLDRCAWLLDAADAPLSDEPDRFEPSDWDSADEDHECRCPACGGTLQLVRMATRRSWRDILYSAAAPLWYCPPKHLRPPSASG